MFERNKIDNVPDTISVPVEITLADGTVAKGKLLAPIGKTVADALNGGGGFVEFEPYGGERSYLAKAQLASVKLVGVPKAAEPQRAREGHRRLRSLRRPAPRGRRQSRRDPPGLFRPGQEPIIRIAMPRPSCRKRCATTCPPWPGASTPRMPPSRCRSARRRRAPSRSSRRRRASWTSASRYPTARTGSCIRLRGRWAPAGVPCLPSPAGWRHGLGVAFSLS